MKARYIGTFLLLPTKIAKTRYSFLSTPNSYQVTVLFHFVKGVAGAITLKEHAQKSEFVRFTREK